MIAGTYYVQRSSNPRASLPWQVRRHLADQTFYTVDHYAVESDAREAADTFNRWAQDAATARQLVRDNVGAAD